MAEVKISEYLQQRIRDLEGLKSSGAKDSAEVKISEFTLQQRILDLEHLQSIEGKGSALFSLIVLPPLRK